MEVALEEATYVSVRQSTELIITWKLWTTNCGTVVRSHPICDNLKRNVLSKNYYTSD